MYEKRKALRYGIFAAPALIAALFLCACAAPAVVAATPAPVAEATPVPQDTAAPTPAAQIATPAPEEILAEEIDGIAEPGDVLPEKKEFTEAKALNPDVIGWITVPDTVIDYPVVRCGDNEYYLTHNVEKGKSKHGAIFMDYRNADSEQQRHIVIYGHNMKNGTMFHDLNNYKQQSFFDQNRIITFDWNGQETKWEVYAAYVVQSDVYYIHTRFISAQNFSEYMNELIKIARESKYSVVDERVSIKTSDQVLTLSTCTYEYDNSRFVVSARRIQ